ncbi:MAG TPA: hypothetical protein VFD58_13730 [Blastocatellia bacterium]|nr:hypothetical protein [Blastocatellia bacterium]
MKALLTIVLSSASLAAGALPATAQAQDRPRTVAENQQPDKPPDALKKLTAEEQTAINSGGGANDRTKNYLRVAGGRLKNTRALLDQEKYSEAEEQLEIYAAVIADAGRFLAASVKPRDKAHKTMEQNLKEQLHQLDGIRRDTPAAYLDAADKAVKTAERVRLQSLKAALGAEEILKTPNEQI